MVWRGVVLIVVFFGSCLVRPCFGEEYAPADKYAELEKRVRALEEKLTEQDKCIHEQDRCILEQKQKISAYEERLAQFDQKLHRETGAPIAIAEGLEIGAGTTMIIQGAHNTNAGESKKESRTDASFSTDITLGKEFKDINGKAFVHLQTGQGAGLDDNLSLYSWVNGDADDDNYVRVNDFWYEQVLFGGKALVTVGKLNPTLYFDNNAVANDETTQFLSGIFGNNPALEFPDNAAGMRMAVLPAQWFELGYGVLDADSDGEKIGDNLFTIVEFAFKPQFKGLGGAYRFQSWRNNADHTRWLASENDKEPSFGFGVSFDQKVSELITVFTRYGWQDPEVYNPAVTATGGLPYSLEYSWSAGLQVVGKPWGRENDIVAFAVGQCIPSGDYKKAGADLDPERQAKSEGYFETYYNIRINKHVSISPDFQYIWNPFGRDITDDTGSIFVGGMRAQVDF
jgi:high affinity Mn2+ porin